MFENSYYNKETFGVLLGLFVVLTSFVPQDFKALGLIPLSKDVLSIHITYVVKIIMIT